MPRLDRLHEGSRKNLLNLPVQVKETAPLGVGQQIVVDPAVNQPSLVVHQLRVLAGSLQVHCHGRESHFPARTQRLRAT